MKYLIYGDDLQLVAENFSQLLKQIKSAKPKIKLYQFNPEKEGPDAWLGLINQSLFEKEKIIKIQHLFTGRRTKFKEEVKKSLKKLNRPGLVFIIVEEKLLRNPPRYFDKVLKSKKKAYLFDLLDKIGNKELTKIPQLLQQDNTPYELLMFMILKRIEDLVIWQKTNQPAKGFYQQKLKSQSRIWSLNKLLNFQHNLLKFDLNYKNGNYHYQDPKLALGLFLFTYKEV